MSNVCLCLFSNADNVEAELLHTFTKVYKFDTMLLMVRLAVLTAVTLTVPIVLFPVSTSDINTHSLSLLLSLKKSNKLLSQSPPGTSRRRLKPQCSLFVFGVKHHLQRLILRVFTPIFISALQSFSSFICLSIVKMSFI